VNLTPITRIEIESDLHRPHIKGTKLFIVIQAIIIILRHIWSLRGCFYFNARLPKWFLNHCLRHRDVCLLTRLCLFLSCYCSSFSLLFSFVFVWNSQGAVCYFYRSEWLKFADCRHIFFLSQKKRQVKRTKTVSPDHQNPQPSIYIDKCTLYTYTVYMYTAL